jgi:hypothetical protein
MKIKLLSEMFVKKSIVRRGLWRDNLTPRNTRITMNR